MKDRPAFPLQFKHETVGEGFHAGMTLRQWFAGQALAGLASQEAYGQEDFPGALVDDAFRVADEMLSRKRSRRGEGSR